MHPVIAWFLDPAHVKEAFAKMASGKAAPTREDQAFLQAARDNADRSQLLAKAGDKEWTTEQQQAALSLAVFATLKVAEADPQLAPALSAARAALLGAGANSDDIQQLLGLVFLEEAFAFDDEADGFDQAIVLETLRSMPKLAALTDERVTSITETFVAGAKAAERPMRLMATEALFGAAWEDGPQPISPEHAEEALDRIVAEGTDEDLPAAHKTLKELVQYLTIDGLVGELRARRLEAALDIAASVLAGDGEEEFDDEDDALDDGELEDDGLGDESEDADDDEDEGEIEEGDADDDAEAYEGDDGLDDTSAGEDERSDAAAEPEHLNATTLERRHRMSAPPPAPERRVSPGEPPGPERRLSPGAPPPQERRQSPNAGAWSAGSAIELKLRSVESSHNLPAVKPASEFDPGAAFKVNPLAAAAPRDPSETRPPAGANTEARAHAGSPGSGTFPKLPSPASGSHARPPAASPGSGTFPKLPSPASASLTGSKPNSPSTGTQPRLASPPAGSANAPAGSAPPPAKPSVTAANAPRPSFGAPKAGPTAPPPPKPVGGGSARERRSQRRKAIAFERESSKRQAFTDDEVTDPTGIPVAAEPLQKPLPPAPNHDEGPTGPMAPIRLGPDGKPL